MMKLTGAGQDKRVWMGGGAVLAVLIVLAGWFVVIHPQLSAASADRSQTAGASQQNRTLQQRNDDLKAKNGDQGALQAGLAAALAQLPSEGALPAFTRQLSAQATAAGVVLTSVIVGAASPVVAAVGQSAAPAAAPASPAVATTAAVAPATAAGLVQTTITVNATGIGRHDLAFLRAIQWNGPRRALVTAVQLVPTGGSAIAATTAPATTTGTTTTGVRATGPKTTGTRTTGVTTPTTTVGSAATGTAATGTAATGTAATGIDGPCTLTMTLTIFTAPLSPSAQADLEKLLSGK